LQRSPTKSPATTQLNRRVNKLVILQLKPDNRSDVRIFFFGRIGNLPKSSSALDHLPKVDCTLVKYPTKGLVVFMIYPKGVLCKLTNYPLIGHENDYFGASLF
jgi:hypothetical protein